MIAQSALKGQTTTKGWGAKPLALVPFPLFLNPSATDLPAVKGTVSSEMAIEQALSGCMAGTHRRPFEHFNLPPGGGIKRVREKNTKLLTGF
jgi:hypothetical protein